MSSKATLEERVTQLEQQVAAIAKDRHKTAGNRQSDAGEPGRDDWTSAVGMFDGDPVMKDIIDETLKVREEDRKSAVIVLDADHITLLQHEEGGRGERVRDRVQDCSDRDIHVTAISIKEQMRGWLAAIRRQRSAEQQVTYYDRLTQVVRFFARWRVHRFDAAAERFDRLRSQCPRVGIQDLKIVLPVLTAAITLAIAVVCAQGAEKAPFRVLFSNDTTNITSNVSPYHKRGEPFRPEMLEASVDETAGCVDVHMLQPGGGWVPWWKSEICPADEHYRWLKEKARVSIDSIGEYMLNGGDLVQVFVNRCRQRSIVPFVSLRLNDYHGNEYADLLMERVRGHEEGGASKPGVLGCWQSRFYLEHPEYRIAHDPPAYKNNADKLVFKRDHGLRYQIRVNRVFNWAVPAVREHKLALIAELCQNYDIGGFELDFMRHARYFHLNETTAEQRVQIMTDFVSRVRLLLDRTAKTGQRRWLCVRVPFRMKSHRDLGIDLRKWVDAGVDMVNLSCHFVTEQQSDLAEVCRLVPEAAVYLETTYVSHRYSKPTGPRVSANEVYRKMTAEQFTTAAHLAHSRGGSGVSAFNFIYYRSLAEAESRCEPPFDALARLRDPDWVARQPQHYFTTRSGNPRWPSLMRIDSQALRRDRPVKITLDMAPPAGGWQTDGRLRVQAKTDFGDRQLVVRFNGTTLETTTDVSEPYANPYPDGLGSAETLHAWEVPVRLLKDGANTIVIQMPQGEPLVLSFVDLAAR